MVSIAIHEISLSRGAKILVDGFSTVIGDDSCVGIFGPNGCGKSTLLQAILGEVPLDGGQILFNPGPGTVGYLPQLRELPGESTVRDVLRFRTGVADAERRLGSASRRLETDSSPDAEDAFNEALNRFISLGVDSLDDRAPTVLADLGCAFSLERTCEGLSGGELARVSLAAILLSQFDVLLLDEPTNDLDEVGLRFLTDFVTSRMTPVLLVSHDRRFLEATITAVLEFDPYLNRVVRFDGGYQAWQRERVRTRSAAIEATEQFDQQVVTLNAQIQASKNRADSGVRAAKREYSAGHVDKLQRGAMLEGATSSAGSVRKVERKLAKLSAPEQVRRVWSLRLQFPAPPGPPGLFVLDNIVVKRGEFELGPISLTISPGQRARINGPNGSGKSLLINVLTGSIGETGGRSGLPQPGEIGVLDQQRSSVPAQQERLVDWFPDASGLEPVEARTLLAKFGLGGDDVTRPMHTLSPGERTRVGLALLTTKAFGALILDEPTNHLDLPAIEQLESALCAYDGTLIVVTHDEEFAERLAVDQLIELRRQ